MLVASEHEDSPSYLFLQVVALIADGDPVCIGLYDNNPAMILEPASMGYFLGREHWQVQHTIEWLQELRDLLGTMAENLRTIRQTMPPRHRDSRDMSFPSAN